MSNSLLERSSRSAYSSTNLSAVPRFSLFSLPAANVTIKLLQVHLGQHFFWTRPFFSSSLFSQFDFSLVCLATLFSDCNPASAARDSQQSPSVSEIPMPTNDAPHLTALIIIAQEVKRYSLDKPLRRAGFKIRDASNGEDGLRLAMESPDLIILDLHRPDMRGFEVCCRLKAHAATAAIPVLHLSDAPVESKEFASHLERGDEAYLTYPVEEVELLSFVNTLIRGRHAQRQFTSFF